MNRKVVKPLALLGDSYLGNGYHSYGSIPIDVSGLPANSDFTIYWNCYTIPNRFNLSTGFHTESSDWKGTASWGCGWGPGSLSTNNTGSLSIDIGTYSTIYLLVETCNANPASNYDQWEVSY